MDGDRAEMTVTPNVTVNGAQKRRAMLDPGMLIERSPGSLAG